MNWHRFKRDAKRTVLGSRPRIPLVGGLAVLAYNAVLIAAGGYGSDLVGHAGGFVGGLVAGAVVGTRWPAGAKEGARAGGLGATMIVALTVVASPSMALATASGFSYLSLAALYGLVTFAFFAPVYVLGGAIGGALGTLGRRFGRSFG